MARKQLSSPGPGVDAQGTPVIDPTLNVRHDLAASERRQDDLRDVSAGWQERMADLRFQFTEQLAALRAAHGAELRQAETERLDAIRRVDQGNVEAAAKVQTQAASTLAGQVAGAADAMRTQVETTRQQLQAQIAATNEPLLHGVAELRKVQYETAGSKAQTVETRDVSAGRMGWTYLAVGVVAVVGVVLIQQLGTIRRTQLEGQGGRAQAIQAQVRRDVSLGQVAALVMAVLVFLSLAVATVALILHG